MYLFVVRVYMALSKYWRVYVLVSFLVASGILVHKSLLRVAMISTLSPSSRWILIPPKP